MTGGPRKSARVGMLAALTAPPAAAQPAASRSGGIARRHHAGALRALVDGVEVVGRLPAARGVTRHRLRILVSSGAPVPANLNQSTAGAWISIESPGIAQDAADRLAEAAFLRLGASFPGLSPPASP